MYYASLDIPTDVLQAQRETIKTAPGKMADYIVNVVKPQVQTLVQSELAPYPGEVVHPFEFATAKSRRWYFANRVQRGSKQGRYQRSGDLAQEWVVEVDRRRNEGFMSVRNTDPAAIYIFGARQVPGHARTGWGKNFPQKIVLISDAATDLIIDGWYGIVSGEL